jgi:hypothetical protein
VGLEQDARQRPVAARAEGDQLAGGDRGIGRNQHVTVAAEANEGHNITPVLALARGYPLHAVRQQQGKDTPSGGDPYFCQGRNSGRSLRAWSEMAQDGKPALAPGPM